MLKGLRSLKNKVISHAIQEIIKIQSAVDARNLEKCSLLTVAYSDYSYNFVIKQLSSQLLFITNCQNILALLSQSY